MDNKLKPYVKALRQTMTPEEQLLWRLLRNRRFANYKFRRQHPVGPFILDFACNRPKVAIELDGGQHTLASCYDGRRTQWLERRGWVVLRFWNNELTENTEGVLLTVLDVLKQLPIPELLREKPKDAQ